MVQAAVIEAPRRFALGRFPELDPVLLRMHCSGICGVDELGTARFAPLITHRIALPEVGDALELAQTGTAMKVLVAPNGPVERVVRGPTGPPPRG